MAGPATASSGESSALAVYGGLSRCAPRPLMRPPSLRPQGPLCPHPTRSRLGSVTWKSGLKPKTWPGAGPVRAWPASLSTCLAIESLRRCAPRASNTLVILWPLAQVFGRPNFHKLVLKLGRIICQQSLYLNGLGLFIFGREDYN